MVSINYAFREICCKIVFYGPGLSGKTTNLIYIHKKAPPQTKGELISLATDADRTLYFDFLPLDIGQVQGFSTKFQLYTVPGQVYYNATRKLVLRGVDGLVFVADSQVAKLEENIESMHNLMENLEEYGYDLEELPMVMQYNKRDLEEVSSIEELEKILNPRGLPYFEAVAVNGAGVFDTLKGVSKLVLEKARGKSEPEEKKELISVAAQPSAGKEKLELESVPEKVSVRENIEERGEKDREKPLSDYKADELSSVESEEKVEEVDKMVSTEKAEGVSREEKKEKIEEVEKIESIEKAEGVSRVEDEEEIEKMEEIADIEKAEVVSRVVSREEREEVEDVEKVESAEEVQEMLRIKSGEKIEEKYVEKIMGTEEAAEVSSVESEEKIEEVEKLGSTEIAEEVLSVEGEEKIEEVEKIEIIEIEEEMLRAENEEKVEELEDIESTEKAEEISKLEAKKSEEESLIQSRSESMKESHESKKATEEKDLEQQVEKEIVEKSKPIFQEKVIISPILKRKKTKSAWGGFLWRWIGKIIGRR